MTSRLMDPKDKDGYPTGAPSKSILDPSFKYTDSRHTDVGALYKRVRREILESKKPPRPVSVLTRKLSNERS